MTKSETVSVIVPTHNRRELLAISVESILNQTFPVLEVIIVDDGSTDGTAEAVALRLKEDSVWRERVRFIHQPNQGQSAANNAGISVAKGDWLAFNASDDLWLPNKLEMQLKALQQFGGAHGVCFSDAWFMNNPYMKHTVFEASGCKQDQIFGIVRDATRVVGTGGHPVWMQTVLARADLVKCVGGIDPDLHYSEDHDFIFRLALHTKFCFVSIPLVLIDRSPAESRHTGLAKNWHREEFCLRMDQLRLEKQLLLCSSLSPDVQNLARRQLCSLHQAWANLHINQGEYLQARESMTVAATYGRSLKMLLKSAALRMVPSLLRRAVVRDKANALRYDRLSWLADQSVGTI